MVADCFQNTLHTQTLEERRKFISSTSCRNSIIRFSASSTSEIGAMSGWFLIITDLPSRNQLCVPEIRFIGMHTLMFSSVSSSLKVRNNCHRILDSSVKSSISPRISQGIEILGFILKVRCLKLLLQMISCSNKSAIFEKHKTNNVGTGVTLFLDLLMEFSTVIWDSNTASIFWKLRIFWLTLPGWEGVQIGTKWL